ncbi:MAG: hypothetical protein WC924_01070 [Candidatus Gracilibacteria bacterium]
MKKLFLLTAALLGCTVTPLATNDSQFCLDTEPFHDGIGQFSMTGYVLNEKGEAPFSGKMVDIVYLTVTNDGTDAFDYFYERAETGKIDKLSAGQLYLKLGVLEDEILSSSAIISTQDELAILNALNSGEEVTLSLRTTLTLGQGAVVSSVNPCLIEFQLPE